MSRKTGLGRGLDALIPGSEQAPSGGVLHVLIEHIQRNPRQPRSQFDPGELAELAASIREHGILQPLILSPGDEPDRYVLIAGERRLLAARQAGMRSVPALVRATGEQQRLELALIENLQRTDLTALEAAEAYRQLAEDFNLAHEEIADRVGKSRSAVTNTLRLLKLSPVVQTALRNGQISEGHARALLALATPQAQNAALQTILKNNMSVRQTEDLVRKLSGQKPPPSARPAPSAEISALEDRLRSSLGTKVSLNRRANGGTITIHFYSDEELNNLVDMLLGDEPQ